jgi:hypothetical protein
MSKTMMTCPGRDVDHCVCCGRRSPQPRGEWWDAAGELVCGDVCSDHVESGDRESHRHGEVCVLLSE